MSESLNPNGNPVRVGSVILRTPGLQGIAASHLPATPGMRAAESATEALEIALRNENIESQETIEITGTREVPVGGVAARSTSFGEPAIEIEAPDPGADWGQLVLYTDEAGVTTWNFARDEAGDIDATRGGEKRTYVIRRYVGPPGKAEARGLIGAVGKKILKVLVFPILDPLIGKVGSYFAASWEAKKRPYRIRTFTPEDYQHAEAPSVEGGSWSKLSGGRALLMVHGTFSRAHAAFGGLPADYVKAVHQKYDGRVFAFDHFTLSEDPRQNAEWFLRQVPDGIRLELDIICHSRGGLVSRVLAEKQGDLSIPSKKVGITKIVFVAAPNSGTILTDTKYLGDFIDSYTNLLNFFPDTGVTTVLEAVITVAKQLALAAAKGLVGLQAMLPTGDFLKGWLNQGGRDGKGYFALASNFEPTDPGFKSYAKDRLMDAIFKADNDLVVPTAGVYERNGSDLFPIDKNHVFPADAGIPHSGFFADALAREKILGWLNA
jgi:hypothetical protein